VRKLCFALALALTLALVLPGHAAAWDGVQTLTKSRSGELAVAGNEDGRRVVAWGHARGVFVRVAPRGGRFGPRRKIARSGTDVRVAMDERGDTAIVWANFVDADPDRDRDAEPPDGAQACCTRLGGVVLRGDGRLSRRVEVGAPGKANGAPLLVSDGRGRVAMAWQTFDDLSNDVAVYARFGTMRRGFGELRLMSPPGEGGVPMSVGRGRVVYTTHGQTVETFLRASGRLARRVLLDFEISRGQLGTDSSRRQTGAWENGETVTRTPPGPFETVDQREPGRRPRVSVAGSGAAVVAWTPGGFTTPATRLLAQVRPPGESFGAALELDRIEADDVTLSSTDVATDGSAAVGVVYWHRREPDPVLEPRVYLVRPDRDAPERLALPATDSLSVQVLRDARGTLAVATTADGVVARWLR
jgi:hypothetical protein